MPGLYVRRNGAWVLLGQGGPLPPPLPDTTPPSAPGALQQTAITSTSVSFAWQASTDDASGIARYEFSKDGAVWASAGLSLGATQAGLTPSTPYTIRVRAVDGAGNPSVPATLAVTTSAGSTGGTFPFLISLDHGSGRPSAATLLAQAIARGQTGWTHYITTSNPLAWDSELVAAAAAYPNVAIHLQLTSRNYSDAGMDAVLAALPDAWRPGFKYNYFQEPADNLVGDTAGQAAYRAVYTSAANRIRVWNAAHPTRAVSLPWLEFTEYSLRRLYVNNDASQTPGNLIPPVGDFAGILWSLFEYGDNGPGTFTPTTAAIQAQVDRITRGMAQFAPGKLWGLMAFAYTLEMPQSYTPDPNGGVDPYTTTQKQNQAFWLTEAYNRVKAAGAVEVSWYNVKYAGTWGASGVGESRIEVIPETLAAYRALAR